MFATKPISRIFSVLLVAVSILTFPVGQAVAARQDPKMTASGPVRGVHGDLWADIVLGKPDFGEMVPYEITGSRVFNPGGVIVDRSVSPNRIYVYDGGNSRVLGMQVNNQSGRRAELVIGQPALDGYAGCNGDGNYQNYPQRAVASAATLCSMPEFQVSPREGGSFANMAVDSNGNLYIPDFDNHRVLFYTSPFTTDTIADDVWGQVNFSDNECNHNNGLNNPDSSSLCLRSFYNEGFVGGVGLDSANNLWVTDNQNSRVLRFPYNPATGRAGHVADLVLGQLNFTTVGHSSAMNRMFAPAAVRVDAAGKVYVADSLNNRILTFDAPFTNGMTASGTFGASLRLPTAIEFDQSGNTWVSDSGNNQLLRFTSAGVVDKVLFKSQPKYDGSCGSGGTPDGPSFFFPGPPSTSQDPVNTCDSRGSIGIDSVGNIWASGSNFLQDVRRYPAPFPALGVAHAADVELFQAYAPGQSNAVTAKGLSDPRGIAIAGNQLIVSDGGRLMFWNNAPASLTNGKAADGVVMAPNFNTVSQPPIGLVRVDGHNRLWVLRADKVYVYNLPLVTGAAPFRTIQPPVAVRETLTWNPNLDVAGMVVTNDGDYLWLSDPDSHRVIRIADPLTHPEVDVVLGQPNDVDNLCNRGQANPSANTLCFPSSIAMDANGNIFVSDFALEDHGNNRLLEYNANLFPASPPHAIFGVPASHVYGTSGSFTTPGCVNQNLDPLCKPLEPAFNWEGQMVIGMSGYTGKHFPLVYQNPLTNSLPTDTLKDYYSMPTAAYYDAADNLYVADRNRGRLLIYLANSKTISGNAGGAGVTLSYTDGTAKTATTDANGDYSFAVSFSWSGTVTPSKTGFTFTPPSRSYTNVLADQTGQNYAATPITYSISGNAGVAGATLSYTDGTPKTATADGSGDYSLTVSYNWSGTVTPSKAGFTFTPPSRSYANVLTNQTGQDYTATPITYTISGNAGIAGATLSYTDGAPKTATADANGDYTLTVSYNWSGAVMPSKAAFTFTPASRSYTNVLTNQTGQNYIISSAYIISGNAGIAGATLSYTDSILKTATADANGDYSLTVSYNWSGTITPSKPGAIFTPTNRSYSNIVADQAGENYTTTLITYSITGNTGIADATLSYTDGTPKTATADGNGDYSFTVSYNWSGTVTPSKPEYTFTPASRSYTNLLADQTGQNYTATHLPYQISGNTGIAGATLSYTDGTPKTAIADGSGNYSLTVSYGWTGTVTPSKAGATFTPTNRAYANVTTNQTGQNYAVTVAFMSAAAQDGWILESGENSGAGGSLNTAATTFNLGDDPAKKQYLGVLSFNTGASLPDNAVITGVILKVKQQSITGGGNPLATFQGFMVDIKKGFFGIAALQISDFQSPAQKTYGPFKPGMVDNWYSINLTGAKDYVNMLPASSGLTQIRLRFKLDDNNNSVANYLSLFSGNAPATNRPQLVITYRMP